MALFLEGTDTTPQVWEVIQVAAGIDPPISVTEEPSLFWRPSEVTTDRSRPFEGVTGVAYIRTPERGTVTIDLDATAVTDAEISLAGHVEFGEPFCHNIQSTLLLFHDHADEVVSTFGGRWHNAPPDCATTATEPEDEELAGARFQDETLSDGEVTFEEYEAAIQAAADCVRAEGFTVTVPGEGRAVIDPAVDPDELLSFDVQIEAHGVSTDDLVLTCQERWSSRVERAWMEQLLPSDEDRERAMQAAWECGASRGQQQESPPSIQDAYQAVLEFD